MDQQHGGRVFRRAAVARELGGVGERRFAASGLRDQQRAAAHGVARGGAVAAAGQRRGFVEKFPDESDYLGAARGVVGLSALGAVGFGDCVGTVERVVKAAPSRVGGV